MTVGPSRDMPWSNGNMPFQLMNIVPNPKKPTERWSDAPGFRGGVLHEGQLRLLLDPEKHIERTSAYEGSTDRRDPQTGVTQSTADTWIDKKAEARQPAGSISNGVPVHGAGLVDALRAGESIRDPVRLIIQPSRFPRAGNQPVQWEGHHRVAGAAVRQKELRESGAENWSVPVPFELHTSLDQAKVADQAMRDRIKARTFTDDTHRNAMRDAAAGDKLI